ncbi:MAG: hypothetical protein AB1728_02990 [Bacteroidota bacterium]
MKNSLVFFLAFSVQLSVSQTDRLTVVQNDNSQSINVQLHRVDDSVMYVTSGSALEIIPLDNISEILIEQRSTHIGTGGVIGGIVGTIAGIVIGNNKDAEEAKTTSDIKGDVNTFKYGLLGLGIGSIVGGIAGNSVGETGTKSYIVDYMSRTEKKDLLLSLLRKRSDAKTSSALRQPSPDTAQQMENEAVPADYLQIFVAAGTGIPVGEFGATDPSPANGLATIGLTIRGGIMTALGTKFFVAAEVEHARFPLNLSDFERIATIHTSAPWVLTVPSLSVKLCTNPKQENLLFLYATFGAAVTSSPELKMSVNGTTIRQTEGTSTDLAYTVGASMLFSRHVEVNFSYKALKPDFGVTVTQGTTFHFETLTQQIQILSLTMGYYF